MTLTGNKIEKITVKKNYGVDTISVWINGKEYRIRPQTLITILKSYEFEVEKPKKANYPYLINPRRFM